MPRYRSFRDFDWTLLAIALILCTLGVIQIYSATHDSPKFQDAWWKQIVWIGLGLALMWAIASIDYHTLLGQVPLLYGLMVGGLLLTVILAPKIFGARRWLSLGGFNLQVSEFAKLVIILMVARYLSELKRDEIGLRDLVKIGVLVGIPAVLVMRQPDLGTALTYLAVAGSGILIAGLRWHYVAAIALIGGLSLPVAWTFLNDYQKGRLETFLNPYADPRGRGYQVIQSRIAVGHGGMWGTGATRGTQTQLRFLPVAHTDFIFSAFAEEHGFVGVVLVLGLYLLLILLIVQNALAAPDRSGMYICMGVATLLLFHILVNVGMVSGSMPVTGIPLPLMSSGGSHMLLVFLMLGLVNNVRLRRFAN
jgi:rod shape determining protein RodA